MVGKRFILSVMTSWIVLIAFISSFLTILYSVRRKKLEKELDEKIQDLQKQVSEFASELKNLPTHYVDKEEEKAFLAKWQDLFADISRFCHLKKLNACIDSWKFLNDYSNVHKLISDSNAEIRRRESIEKQMPVLASFFEELSELAQRYVSHSDEIKFTQKWQDVSKEIGRIKIFPKDEEYKIFANFRAVCASFHDHFQKSNKVFFQNELKKCDALLSDVDGKSLDGQQRTAVIDDEDRILVLAGAGSGKTLTITAKVKYLCEKKSINPEDILLISFTKKSAKEMTDRIQGKLGIQIEAKTFHKLGLDIIKSADGACPDILDESGLNDFVHDFFERELESHPDLVRALTEYFAYFLEIPKDIEKYGSLGELYQDEKNADLETIKSKYEQGKYIQEVGREKAKMLTTLKNEKVKSLEETKIANFLFLNGINYEYERLYPYEINEPQEPTDTQVTGDTQEANDQQPTGERLRKPYHPDFYLTDYDIYLEHFGISKSFTVPWLSPIEERKYLEGIEWKRNLHQKCGTKLIETYSYYNSEGVLLKKLEEILKENHVEFKPRNFMDVFNTAYKSKTNKYLPEFIKLCCTFIALFKSNNYKMDDIEVLRQKAAQTETNVFRYERMNLFLDIIKIILEEYQSFLLSKNAIDFSDMINGASERVSAGCKIHDYKYIIVDEYQDISVSRFNLLKSIVDRTGSKVFCVGDDWQSIYRFAGSDISLFTDFEKYFGYTDVLKIEKTYRNSQQLIDEASRFILQNPLQLKKDLRSDKSLNYPLVFWGYENDPRDALNGAIKKIVSEFGTKSSILLLGRTNYDREILEESGLFKITHGAKSGSLKYLPNPEIKVNFLTVHKSKGLEADNVIVLNFKDDTLGFPNQIENDDILNLVLTNAECYRYAEERRLFYVAITRTRNRTFILTDTRKPSRFFDEFHVSQSVCYSSIRQNTESVTRCPLCKTGTLQEVEGEYGFFVGCSNYPRCRFTQKDLNILSEPVTCPFCGGFLVLRKGQNGHWFFGCTNYPYCKHTERIGNNASNGVKFHVYY